MKKNKIIEMDEVDSNQQYDIDNLKSIDIIRKKEFFIIKTSGVCVILMVIALFAYLMNTLDLKSPYSCPHDNCPHYKGNRDK